MFSRLIEPEQSIPKRRRRILGHKINVGDELLVVTSNMVNKARNSWKKNESQTQKVESDSESKEPHHHTRLRTEITALQNYKRLAGDSQDDSDYSAIASPCSYVSSRQKRMASHMVDRSDDTDQRMDAQ